MSTKDIACVFPIPSANATPPRPKRYIATFRQYDGSGSGALPRVLSERDVAILKEAGEAFGFEQIVSFVEVIGEEDNQAS